MGERRRVPGVRRRTDSPLHRRGRARRARDHAVGGLQPPDQPVVRGAQRRRVSGAAAAGLLALLAGCGGGAAEPVPGGGGTSVGGGAQIVVATLGDSITAGNPAYDPDPAARRALGFGDDERSQYQYWAEREDSQLELRNCGVFGERTDEIARRLSECAAGAGALVVQGGINDIAQGVEPAVAAEQLAGIVREGQALGLDVAIADVLPWNNGHPAADAKIAELNRLVVRIGSDEGVPVLPFHDTLEDPGEPGVMRSDWTADGDHPSIEGYRRLGELAFSPPGEPD